MSFRQPYLRSLPAVDQLLNQDILRYLSAGIPRRLLLETVQETLNLYRARIMEAESREELEDMDLSSPVLARESARLAQGRCAASLRPVINATGIVLHTNLGRAPLSNSAVDSMGCISGRYSNLELSLETGERGSRQSHVESLLCELTGAEAAAVVNNNAAAVLLVLNTLAKDREVIVSRGQLVEIGGSFRIPEVMSAGGAHLVEVGTTNKCYLKDYEKAIGDKTSLLLKVHTSNYRIMGFTGEVSREELVSLGRKAGLPVVEDLGSGVLVDLFRYGLPHEPRVQDCIAAGVSVVTFSGDKLLGGPQAGIILGSEEPVERCRANQLARALRVDKFTLAALEATLRLYWDEETAFREIPVLRMLTLDSAELKKRARRLLRLIRKEITNGQTDLVEGASRVGGGALPLAEVPSFLVSFKPEGVTLLSLASRLRLGDPPVIARIQDDRFLFDVRTLGPGEDNLIASALKKAMEAREEEFPG